MTGDSRPSERVYRVLLVDDEELLCRAVTRLMRTEKRFAFSAVTSAQQASRAFQDEGPFDILLIDLNLTDGDGVELATAFLQAQPGLEVVFMSGDIPDDFAGRGQALDKPFDREDLVRTLDKALGFDEV